MPRRKTSSLGALPYAAHLGTWRLLNLPRCAGSSLHASAPICASAYGATTILRLTQSSICGSATARTAKKRYRAEVESIGRLLVTQTCRNLVHVFELRERLRNLAPKDSRVRRVHVVGAGTMGGDIAAWCACRGLDVTLQDRAQQYVDPALARARELFAKALARAR